MKNSILKLVFIMGIVGHGSFAGAGGSLPGSDCQTEQVLWGKWMFNRLFTMAEGCLIQVSPIDKNNMTYREYVFDQSGRMLIFNSTPGSFEEATAQQNYFLLPVVTVPQMKRTEISMVITMANGEQVVFSPDSHYIQSMTALTYIEEPQIDLAPGSHFKIENSEGIVLDAGWAIGKRNYKDPQGISTFTKGNQQCQVKNEMIFAYVDPVTREAFYQPILKYTTQWDLDDFLRAYCFFF